MHCRDILYLTYSANAVITAFLLLIMSSFFIINYRSVELNVGISYDDNDNYNTMPCTYLPTNSTVCAPEYVMINNTCIQNNRYCFVNVPSDPKPEYYYEAKIISSRFLDNPVIYSLLLIGIVIFLSPILFFFIEYTVGLNGYSTILTVYILLSIVYVSLSYTSLWIFTISSIYQPIKYCSIVCNSDYYINTSINYDIYSSCCNIYYSEINFDNVPDDNNFAIVIVIFPVVTFFAGQLIAMVILRLLIEAKGTETL